MNGNEGELRMKNSPSRREGLYTRPRPRVKVRGSPSAQSAHVSAEVSTLTARRLAYAGPSNSGVDVDGVTRYNDLMDQMGPSGARAGGHHDG